LLQISVQYGVTNVRVFGSMARGDANESSDVDLLVQPLAGTSLLDLGGLLMDAQELLGRRVDVVSKRAHQKISVNRCCKQPALYEGRCLCR